MHSLHLSSLAILFSYGTFATSLALGAARKTCTVFTSPNVTDNAPAIISAFSKCGQGGNVVFLNETYNVNSVMNTTGLKDCEIDLYGTLLVRPRCSVLEAELTGTIFSGALTSPIG